MHDGCKVALTLDDLADTALAAHLPEVMDCMEVSPATLIPIGPWAYMEVDPVVPHHLEVVEIQVRK